MLDDRLVFNDGPIYPSQFTKKTVGLPNSLRTMQVIASPPLMLTAKIPCFSCHSLLVFAKLDYISLACVFLVFHLYFILFSAQSMFLLTLPFALAGSIRFLFYGVHN
jgi:hypothetical protein